MSGDEQKRRPRRAQRPAAPHTDEHPAESPLTEKAPEDRPERWGSPEPTQPGRGENDERLIGDKPPHWG